MNKEIKEILTEMINLNDYEDYKIYGKRANEIGKLLLDYITNLQQENERLKAIEQEHKRINGELREGINKFA